MAAIEKISQTNPEKWDGMLDDWDRRRAEALAAERRRDEKHLEQIAECNARDRAFEARVKRWIEFAEDMPSEFTVENYQFWLARNGLSGD